MLADAGKSERDIGGQPPAYRKTDGDGGEADAENRQSGRAGMTSSVLLHDLAFLGAKISQFFEFNVDTIDLRRCVLQEVLECSRFLPCLIKF